ncbi:hypothetical protein LTR10_001388 [Elasticomyces elasticus]|nr:hypothetical protein LTR10_001388 [Elasticomyces elasticus]KAK4974889.1 hypothetical protein LTR42_004098 [Elasticomyces elasticus]
MTDNSSITGVRQVCGICGKGGILFKCGRCKHIYYCSKECQTEDWKFHKNLCKVIGPRFPKIKGKAYPVALEVEGCDVGNNKVPGVVIALEHGDPAFGFQGTFMIGFDAADPEFADLPIARSLGFALGAMPARFGLQQFNDKAAVLYIDIDTTSPNFGQLAHGPIGGVVVARRDGRHIKIGHVVAMVEYLRSGCRELGEVKGREAKGEKVDREDIVKRLLNHAAWQTWCESKIQSQVAAGVQGWDGVECPPQDDAVGAGEGKSKVGDRFKD